MLPGAKNIPRLSTFSETERALVWVRFVWVELERCAVCTRFGRRLGGLVLGFAFRAFVAEADA